MTKSGVTYYKLDQRYDGDVTKNCALTGSEIDKNFHFLRGFDIQNAFIDEETEDIVLSRVNCEEIRVTGFKEYIESKIGGGKFDPKGTYYDKETGQLHLIINGNEYLIEGFYTQDDTFVGEGLKGNGKATDPIRISNLYMTGFYKPVERYIDLTSGSKLPLSPIKGERYLTRETLTPYGLLYNYDAIKAISEILSENNSDWRIPSFEDWDRMLNAIELCDNDRNHNNHVGSPYNGKYAGKFLKSKRDWVPPQEDSAPYREYGFNILPSGIREAAQYAQFSKASVFWTNDEDIYGNVHVKKFHGNKYTVQHRLENPDNCYSLRLVRDTQRSFCEMEEIEGYSYKCINMPSLSIDECHGKKVLDTQIWTASNILFNLFDPIKYPNAKAFKVLNASGETIEDDVCFFINEWNGTSWEKKTFNEGEIVIIKEYDGFVNEEITLFRGDLMRRSDILYNRVKEYVDEKIKEEKLGRIAKDEELQEAIDNEKSERIESDELLLERINLEAETRKSKDIEIETKLANEILSREEGDRILSERLDTEETIRKETDNALRKAIEDESVIRHNDDINTKEDYTTFANGGTKLKTYGGNEFLVKFDGDFGTVSFYEEPMDEIFIYYGWYFQNNLQNLNADDILAMENKELDEQSLEFDEMLIPKQCDNPETEEEFERLKQLYDCCLIMTIPHKFYSENTYDIIDSVSGESVKTAFLPYKIIALNGKAYEILVQYDENNALLPIGEDVETSKIIFKITY